MNNHFYFWLATIIYSLFMVLLGFYIWKKTMKHRENDQLIDFWMASRHFPGWRLGISLTAGWLMLGWLGYGMSMIYQMGLSGVWILPLPWLILCVIIFWLVPYVRRLPAVSLPEAIEKRFGSSARMIVAICSVFVFTSWTGAEFFMLGQLAAPFLNISPALVMILFTVVIVTYSYLGGFRAVVLTDIAQFVLMALFILFLGIVSYNAASAITNHSIVQTLAKTPTPSYGPGTMFNILACGIAMPIILLIAYLPGWMIEQDLLLRIQAAKSLKEAYKGAGWGFVLIGLFVIVIPTVIAFNALILFPPAVEASKNLIGADATGIITAIIQTYFPVWAQVLMLLGLIAAQMSTVDTFANVIALPLTNDLIRPALLKNASKETLTKWSRFIFAFSVILGLIYALNASSLMVVYTLSSGVLTAAIAIPAFAIYFKRANHIGIVLCSISGALGTILFYFLEYQIWNHAYRPQWLADTQLGYIIVGIIFSLAGLAVGTILGKVPQKKQLEVIAEKPLEGIEVFQR